MSFFNVRFRDRNLSFTHVKPAEGDVEGLEPVTLHDPIPIAEHSSSATTASITAKADHLSGIMEHEHESVTSESNDEFASASEGEDESVWESSAAVVDTPVLQHDASRFTTAEATTATKTLSHAIVPDVLSFSSEPPGTATASLHSQTSDAVVPSSPPHPQLPTSTDANNMEDNNTTASTTTSSKQVSVDSFSAYHQSSSTTTWVSTASTSTIATTSTVVSSASTVADTNTPNRVEEIVQPSSTMQRPSPVVPATSNSAISPPQSSSSTPTPSRPSISSNVTRSRPAAPAPRLRERMRQSPVPKSRIVQAYLDPSASGELLPSPTSVRRAWLQDHPSLGTAGDMLDATDEQTETVQVESAHVEDHSTGEVPEEPSHPQHSPLHYAHRDEQGKGMFTRPGPPVSLHPFCRLSMTNLGSSSKPCSHPGADGFAETRSGHQYSSDIQGHTTVANSSILNMDISTNMEEDPAAESGWGFEMEEFEPMDGVTDAIYNTGAFADGYSHTYTEETVVQAAASGGESSIGDAKRFSSEANVEEQSSSMTRVTSDSGSILPNLRWSQFMGPPASSTSQPGTGSTLQQQQQQQQHGDYEEQEQPSIQQLDHMEDSWGMDEDLHIEESMLTQHQQESFGELDNMVGDVERSATEAVTGHLSTSLFTPYEPEIPLPDSTTTLATAAVTTTTTTTTTTITTTAMTAAATTVSQLSTSASLVSAHSSLIVQEEGEVASSWGFDMEDIDALATSTSTSVPRPIEPVAVSASEQAHDDASSSLAHLVPEPWTEADIESSWGVDMEDMETVGISPLPATSVAITSTTTIQTGVSVVEASELERSEVHAEQQVTSTSSSTSFMPTVSYDQSLEDMADVEASWGLEEDLNLEIAPASLTTHTHMSEETTALETTVSERHTDVVQTESGSELTGAQALAPAEALSLDLEVPNQEESVEASWGFDEEAVLEPLSGTAISTAIDSHFSETPIDQEDHQHYGQTIEGEGQDLTFEPQSGFEEHVHEDNPVVANNEAPAETASTLTAVAMEQLLTEEQVREMAERHDDDHTYTDGQESDDSSHHQTSRMSLDSVNAAYDNEVRNVLFSDNDTPFMAVQDAVVHEHDTERVSSESSDEEDRDSLLPDRATFHGSTSSTSIIAMRHRHELEGTPEPMNGFSSPRRSGGSSSTPLGASATSHVDDDFAVASQHGHAYGYEELYTTAIATTVISGDHGADADSEDSGSEILRELSTARTGRSASLNRLNDTNDDVDDYLEHMERGVPLDRPISTPENQSDDGQQGDSPRGPTPRLLEDDLVDLLERGETGPSPPTSSRAAFGSTGNNNDTEEPRISLEGSNQTLPQSSSASMTSVSTSGLFLAVKEDIQDDDDQRSLAVETSGSPISTIESVVSMAPGVVGEEMEVEMEQEWAVNDQMPMIVETSTVSSLDSRSLSGVFSAMTTAGVVGTGATAEEGSSSVGVDPVGLGHGTSESQLTAAEAKGGLVSDETVDTALFQEQIMMEQQVQGLLDQEEETVPFASGQEATTELDLEMVEQRQSVVTTIESSTSVIATQHHEAASILFESTSSVVQVSQSAVVSGDMDGWGWGEMKEFNAGGVEQQQQQQQLSMADELFASGADVQATTSSSMPIFEDLFAVAPANNNDSLPTFLAPASSSSVSSAMSHQATSTFEEVHADRSETTTTLAVAPAPSPFEDEQGDVSELFGQQQQQPSLFASAPHVPFHLASTSSPSPEPVAALDFFAPSPSRSPAPVHHDDDVAIPFVFGDTSKESVPPPPIPSMSPVLEAPQQQQSGLELPPEDAVDVGDDAWNDGEQLLEELDQMLEHHNVAITEEQAEASEPTDMAAASSSSLLSAALDAPLAQQPTYSPTSSLDITLAAEATTAALSIERQQEESFADVLFSPPPQDSTLSTAAAPITTSLVEQAIAEDEIESAFEITTTETTEQESTSLLSTLVAEESSTLLKHTTTTTTTTTTITTTTTTNEDEVEETKEDVPSTFAETELIVFAGDVAGNAMDECDGWDQEELETAIEEKNVSEDTLSAPLESHPSHASSAIVKEEVAIDAMEAVHHELTAPVVEVTSDLLPDDEGSSEQGEEDAVEESEEKALPVDWDEEVEHELTELQGLRLDQVIEEQAMQVASLEHPEGVSHDTTAITSTDLLAVKEDTEPSTEVKVDDAWGLDEAENIGIDAEQPPLEVHARRSIQLETSDVLTGSSIGALAATTLVGTERMTFEEQHTTVAFSESHAAVATEDHIQQEQQQQEKQELDAVVSEVTSTSGKVVTTTASVDVSLHSGLLEDTVGDEWDQEGEELDFGLVQTEPPFAHSTDERLVPQEETLVAVLEQEHQQEQPIEQESLHVEEQEQNELHVDQPTTAHNISVPSAQETESSPLGETPAAEPALVDMREDRMVDMDGDDGWGQEGLEFEILATAVPTAVEQQQESVMEAIDKPATSGQLTITETVAKTDIVAVEDAPIASTQLDAWDADDDAWDQDDLSLQIQQPVAAASAIKTTTTTTTTTTTIITAAVDIMPAAMAEDVEPKSSLESGKDAWGQDEFDFGIHEPVVQQQPRQEEANVNEDEAPLPSELVEPKSWLDTEVDGAWGHEEIDIQLMSTTENQETSALHVNPQTPPLSNVPAQEPEKEGAQIDLEQMLEDDAWGLDAQLSVPVSTTTTSTFTASIASAVVTESVHSVDVSTSREVSESVVSASAITVEQHDITAEQGWGFDDDEDLQQQLQLEQREEEEPQPVATEVAEETQPAQDHESVVATEDVSKLHRHRLQSQSTTSILSSVTLPPRLDLFTEYGAGLSLDRGDAKEEPLAVHSDKRESISDRDETLPAVTGSSHEHDHHAREEEELEDSSSWQDISPASVISKHSDAVISLVGSEIESDYSSQSMAMVEDEHRALPASTSSSSSSSSLLAAVAMEPSLSWTDLKHEHESSGEWQHDSVESVASDKKDETLLEDLLKDSGDGWGDMDDSEFDAPTTGSAAPTLSRLASTTFATTTGVPSRNNTPSPSIFINRQAPPSEHSLSPTSPMSTSSITSTSLTATAVATMVSEEEDDSHLPQAIRRQRARLRAMGKPLPPISKYKSTTTSAATTESPSSALSPTAASSTLESKSVLLSPALQKQRERLEKKRAAAKFSSSPSSSPAAAAAATTSASSAASRPMLAATLLSPIGVLGGGSVTSSSTMSPSSPVTLSGGVASRVMTITSTSSGSSSTFATLNEVSGHAIGHGILSPRLSTESRPSMEDIGRRSSPRRGSAASSTMSFTSSSPVLHARHVHHHHQHQGMTAMTGSLMDMAGSGGVVSRKSKDTERRVASLGSTSSFTGDDTVEVVHSSETDIYGSRAKNISSSSSSGTGGGWDMESHWEEHESVSVASGSVPQTPTLHSRGGDRRGFGLGLSGSTTTTTTTTTTTSGWGSLSSDLLGMSKSMSEQQHQSTYSEERTAESMEETRTTRGSSFFRQTVPGIDGINEEESKGDDEDRYGSRKKAPPASLPLSSSSSSIGNTGRGGDALPKSSSSSWSLGSWVSSAVAVANSAVDRAYESLDPDYSRMKRGIVSPDMPSSPLPPHQRPGYMAGGSSLAMGQASILTSQHQQQQSHQQHEQFQQRERSMSSASSGSLSQSQSYQHLSRKSYHNEQR
ncbi:hypothetical protein BGZ73_004144 [Actinomortierella ambigua]|nr:hypothetical protein BGZ73_004144 [Actinomortierella ambigua]